MIFWKQAWLKPISRSSSEQAVALRETPAGKENPPASASGCTESNVFAQARLLDSSDGEPRFVCQATQLPYATTRLDWWDIRQYVEDYASGNISLWRIISGTVYFLYHTVSQAGIGLGRPMRWFYDKLYPLWRGSPFPRRTGSIPEGQPTPVKTLDLQSGELVRIKSYAEILKTLDTSSRNRGLYWDAEEVPYCGGTYRVLKRVTKIIDEKTGKMQEMRTPCVTLDSVVCEGRYSECRLFCPRSIYPYWREIWLERVGPKASDPQREKETGVVAQC